MSVLSRLSQLSGLAVLIDPTRTDAATAADLAARAADDGVAVLLVGSSYVDDGNVGAVARAVKLAAPGIPLLEFPGAASHLVPDVDAVLVLSLVSGRNPQYLIEEHVRAVPFFERHPDVEPISTAYLLIDGGEVTSVEAVTQTRPLPAGKPELVAAHVRAAMLVGMSATYLDAGSGARRPVAPALVRAARAASRGPLFVGGGVRTPDAVREARDAGADFVVVGTLFERHDAPAVREFALAART
jgi:geranylgeranylglyceryl phosphate synthase family protein